MTFQPSAPKAFVDKRTLQRLGTLIPIRLHPLRFFVGRHPLRRPGSGMRFLRNRPFEPGEDSPRDLDRFSHPDDPWVTEWEAEAQARVLLLGDVSGSMAFPPKAGLRNLALLQLTYSLWRAGEQVEIGLFGPQLWATVREANLGSTLERLLQALLQGPALPGTNPAAALRPYLSQRASRPPDLVFVVSDFAGLSPPGPPPPGDPWSTLLRSFRSRIVPTLVTFSLPEEPAGLIKAWDPERGVHRVTLLSAARARRINAEERRRVAELGLDFWRRGVDFLVLKSQRDIYPQLVRLARIRRKRSA